LTGRIIKKEKKIAADTIVSTELNMEYMTKNLTELIVDITIFFFFIVMKRALRGEKKVIIVKNKSEINTSLRYELFIFVKE
jgi:hypothetical protein